MMKRRMLLQAIMMSCAAMGFAQHTVTAKLSDLKDGDIIVRYIDLAKRTVAHRDTLTVKDGTFYLDAKGDKAQMAQIAGQQQGSLRIFIVPGEQGVLTGTMNHAEWSGSKFYTDLAKLEKTTDPLYAELRSINDDYSNKVKAGANADSLHNIIMPSFRATQKKIADLQMDFIKNNPANDVSATLLMYIDDVQQAINLLSPSVKTGKFSEIVAGMQVLADRQKAQAEAAARVAPGKMAPAFTLKTPEGADLSLASLRGKYLILDFWGSWCGWCIKGFPDMKKYYEKYKSKLEILGVDCRDTQDKWKAAIAKYELPWKHVYNPDNSSLTAEYAIEGYPTKVIIDPDGKIVKTIEGEDPAFYTYLDELFNN